jgi:uncharacterized membrane protein
MDALTVVLGIALIAAAAVTVLVPGARPNGWAMAAASAVAGLLALTLGSVAVFAVEVVGALLLLGLNQVLVHDHDDDPGIRLTPTLALAGLAAAGVLVVLGAGAILPAWPAAFSGVAGGLGHALLTTNLVALAAAITLVITAGLAFTTLRQPRAAHRATSTAPRRSTSPASRRGRRGRR